MSLVIPYSSKQRGAEGQVTDEHPPDLFIVFRAVITAFTRREPGLESPEAFLQRAQSADHSEQRAFVRFHPLLELRRGEFMQRGGILPQPLDGPVA